VHDFAHKTGQGECRSVYFCQRFSGRTPAILFYLDSDSSQASAMPSSLANRTPVRPDKAIERVEPERTSLSAAADLLYRVSLVIPVYRGERTLPSIIDEVRSMTVERRTDGGLRFVVCEVLLVHDCGPDGSDRMIERLALENPFVRPVWLSRNYGQHAATLAGMAGAVGDWVATIDEDGQQDPSDIATMLDEAVSRKLQLVYARPINPPPHGWLRNIFSRTAKAITARILGNDQIGRFNSFRLVDGEIARTLAAYCGNGVYLDVGLFWITGRIGHAPIRLRSEMDRPSGYSYLRLLGHFWNLILTTGTRPLRLITLLGMVSMVLAVVIGLYTLYGHLTGRIPVQGWASLLIVVAFFSGSILMALGVIAEYLAVTMGIVMGKPLYVVSTRPTRPVHPAVRS
jgi:undecaprenyl-phosphate 4-deoxy-4-formamido-L-arabinose transferase